MTQQVTQSEFPCQQCGGKMAFNPSGGNITCQYCGHVNLIAQSQQPAEELDYHAFLARQAEHAESIEAITITCSGCGAVTNLPPDITADKCPFCGSPVVTQGESGKLIKPKSVLPFAVNKTTAFGAFRKWTASRWFAPGRFARAARTDSSSLAGMYIPHWTYDCAASTSFKGQRGDNYTETETYTTTENGQQVTRTRHVTKVRWTYVEGTVRDDFDDVLVLASRSIPRKQSDRLEPWKLEDLQPYDEKYMAGFRCESYQIGLEEGFATAKEKMAPTITRSIERAIGGDRQRVDSQHTTYSDITFKHVLLPVWISAYRFGDKVFRFLVNARTGEVQGERPWSIWKIVAFAGSIAAAVAGTIYLLAR